MNIYSRSNDNYIVTTYHSACVSNCYDWLVLTQVPNNRPPTW